MTEEPGTYTVSPNKRRSGRMALRINGRNHAMNAVVPIYCKLLEISASDGLNVDELDEKYLAEQAIKHAENLAEELDK